MDEFDSISLNQSILNKSNFNIYKIFRCPQCNLIPFIFFYNKNELQNDFDNKFYLLCPNQHEYKINSNDIFSYNQNDINDSICNICNCNSQSEKNELKIYYCFDCFNFFCKKCKEFHNLKENEHHLINIKKMDSTCFIHNKNLSGFCKIHKVNFCDYCEHSEHLIIERHKRFNQNELENFAEILKQKEENLNEIKNKFEKILENIKKSIFNLKNIFNKFLNDNNNELYYINTIFFNYKEMDKNKKLNYQIIKNLNNIIFNKDFETCLKNLENVINFSNNLYQTFYNKINLNNSFILSNSLNEESKNEIKITNNVNNLIKIEKLINEANEENNEIIREKTFVKKRNENNFISKSLNLNEEIYNKPNRTISENKYKYYKITINDNLYLNKKYLINEKLSKIRNDLGNFINNSFSFYHNNKKIDINDESIFTVEEISENRKITLKSTENNLKIIEIYVNDESIGKQLIPIDLKLSYLRELLKQKIIGCVFLSKENIAITNEKSINIDDIIINNKIKLKKLF